MSPVSIHTQAFISYCSPVQDRLAGTNTGVYEFDSLVVWTPLINKCCKCIMCKDTNKHDEYTADDWL